MKHSKRKVQSEMARKICCALILGVAFSLDLGLCAEKTSRPNIVLIMSDLKNESTELYRDLLAEEEKGNAMAKNLLGWLRQPPHEEVYDTETDPFELQNLAGKPEVADVQKRLRESLRAWLTEVNDEALPKLNPSIPTKPIS